MSARLVIAAALLATAPALAIARPEAPEAKVRNMSEYLEAVVDSRRGVYIRAYDGQWYYARTRGECPRLTRFASLRFSPSPGGDFDRYSSLRADGWRCFVASVVESDGPPRRRR